MCIRDRSLTDSFVGERADPQAHERSGATRIVVEVAEDKLSLASGDVYKIQAVKLENVTDKQGFHATMYIKFNPEKGCLLYTSRCV